MKRALQNFLFLLVAVSLVSISILSVVGALNSQPQVFFASATADTYISSSSPSKPFGASQVLWVSDSPGGSNWTFIRFGLSGKLRPGDLVLQATITLTFAAATAPKWPVSVLSGRTISNWSESTTFGDRTMVGFDTATSASTGPTAPVPGTTLAIDVSKQLHRWQSYGGPSNFGTAILPFHGENAALGFASRENLQLPPPVLEVHYQPGPKSIYGYGVSPALAPLARFD